MEIKEIVFKDGTTESATIKFSSREISVLLNLFKRNSLLNIRKRESEFDPNLVKEILKDLDELGSNDEKGVSREEEKKILSDLLQKFEKMDRIVLEEIF